MARLLVVVLGVFLAGCVQPAERILPSPDAQGVSITPSASARLARYDGMKMRARLFTLKNGVKQVRATRALQFKRVGDRLSLEHRSETFMRVSGEGWELVGGGVAHDQQLPNCEVGVAMENQPQLPCFPPWCGDVDDVEPCTPDEEYGGGGEGGGGEGDPVQTFFTQVFTNTSYANDVADTYTAFAAADSTVPLSAVHEDSILIVAEDLDDGRTGAALTSEGRLLSVNLAVGGAYTQIDFAYEGDNLSALYQSIVTDEGDTLVVEITEELTEYQLYGDMRTILGLSASMRATDHPCWAQGVAAGGALLMAGILTAPLWLPATMASSTVVVGVTMAASAIGSFIPPGPRAAFEGAVSSVPYTAVGWMKTVHPWTKITSTAGSIVSVVVAGASLVSCLNNSEE